MKLLISGACGTRCCQVFLPWDGACGLRGLWTAARSAGVAVVFAGRASAAAALPWLTGFPWRLEGDVRFPRS